MKYCLINYYTGTLQIRNTSLRLIRYIRSWNIKHPDKPISRFDIKSVDKVEYRPLNFIEKVTIAFNDFMGIESNPKTLSDNVDPITASKAYKDKYI